MTFTIESTPLATTSAPIGTPVDRGVRVAGGLRDAFVVHGDVAEQNLDRLFTSGTLCVTTGQQPGLFLGPAYTLHKALSAIAWAQVLEKSLGRSVVPVFWVAGDDHDFVESNHTHVLAPSGEIVRIELRNRPPEAPSVPLYREPLGHDISRAFEELSASLPDTEFRETQLEWLTRYYTSDATFADAFAGAMSHLLSRFGLVVFQSSSPSAKEVMRPHLLNALDHASDLDVAIAQATETLGKRGAPTPVRVKKGETLVMVEGALGRDRLVQRPNAFQARRSGERWSSADLSTFQLSPNVLLRPAIEAAILPTVGYVAGPGEAAYFPQARPVYDTLKIPAQAVVLRWSGRVMEHRVAKVLHKYDLRPEQLSAPEGALERELVQADMPAAIVDRLASLRNSLSNDYATLVQVATSIDPTLKKPIESAQRHGLNGVDAVERRILGRLKDRNEVVSRQIGMARHALFPLGKPQERVFNPLQYLVRYGDSYLDAVFEACTHWSHNLQT